MKYQWRDKVVGTLDEQGVLTKRGKQIHRLNYEGSFGTAKEILSDPQVKTIRFKWAGRTYSATTTTILARGFDHLFRWPTGYLEPQVQLRQEEWDVE